jgi:hypothetical protein
MSVGGFVMVALMFGLVGLWRKIGRRVNYNGPTGLRRNAGAASGWERGSDGKGAAVTESSHSGR